jgi:RHS repeat-associated protein
VYGKVASVSKNTGGVTYLYDAAGQRVAKSVGGVTTHYVRDASGNVMAIYENNVLKELPIYGSSRLGVYKVPAGGLEAERNKLTLGRREYELTNHLGNVLAVVSDVKLPTAKVLSHTDYYAFGSAMPGRSGGAGYRYGFNITDLGARIFSNRIGRFFSTDPREGDYPWQSTYVYFSNSPISIIDFNGEGGDDDKPKGVVNVAFHSASADKKTSPDAVGADKNPEDGKDDALANFLISAANVKDPCLKTFAINKLDEIGEILKKLKSEGYEIGTVILSAHGGLDGYFYLGGKHKIPDLSSVLKGNLGTNSVVVLSMCNIGAGNDPQARWQEIQSVAVKANTVIYASMSFGSGSKRTFSGSKLTVALPVHEYIRAKKTGDLGGPHWYYPDNTILYHNCHIRIGPQLNLVSNYYVVANLTLRSDGYVHHDISPFRQLKKNEALLKEAQRLGRPQGGYRPSKPAHDIPMRMFLNVRTED